MMLVRWLLAKDPTQHLTEEQVRKSLYNIRKRKYIDIVPVKSSGSDDAEFKLELTNKGRDILKTAHLKDLSIEVPQSWDGKWRFIIFDIPEKYRYARDVLRDKLKKLNFFQVQQSAWVHPYECEKEIEFLMEYFGVTQNVLNFATPIKNDGLLKKYFNKKGFDL